MNPSLTVALVQRDFPVGDIAGNVRRVVDALAEARALKPDLLVFPELTLTGYPPEDLLFRHGFLAVCEKALAEVAAAVSGPDVLVGHPLRQGRRLYNAVSWIRDGEIIGQYAKQALPNYAVFDEKRYFDPGHQALTVVVKGVRVGVLICEDIWEELPALRAAEEGCDLIVVPNASPYHLEKRARREAALIDRANDSGKPIVYGNLVGGQDELVFDGRSFAAEPNGRLVGPTAAYAEGLFAFGYADGHLRAQNFEPDGPEDTVAVIYQTLIRGTRDYVHKNGFTDVLLGLSGGIDSALTLAIAVDALGAEHVRAVMLPSRHTSELSVRLAADQARLLGVTLDTVSIEPAYRAFLESLGSRLAGDGAGLSRENLQARCRGAALMALSNRTGALLLTTGNKSELAVGYCTLYGDMCGGFAPIKDCAKTRVYELAEYRNTLSPAIPSGVIERAPTAELAPGQTDQDSLPPYPMLDEIIARYVERDQSIEEIVAAGFDRDTVARVARLVHLNEYKRRQSAPGIRITPRAFGRDRRYPITNQF